MALAQWTAQAAAGKEALSVEVLINQFLDANRIALEETGRVSTEYDTTLWEETAEACQRKELGCIPNQIFAKIDEDRRAKAKAVAASTVKAEKSASASDGQARSNYVKWQPHEQGWRSSAGNGDAKALGWRPY